MEFGLLLLRVVIGALFVGHGTQKLLGWFGGPGIDGTHEMMASLGYRRPREAAVAAGAGEAGAGTLLVLGLFTPFAAAAVIGVMLNAIVTVHRRNGLWNSSGGYEYNLVLMAAAAALAFVGPGLLALDGAFGFGLAGIGWGLFAVLLGIVAGGAMLVTHEPTVAEVTSEEEQEPAEEERRAA